MTTTTHNEAAERLRMKITTGDTVTLAGMVGDLDEALAAERRAGRLQALGECMCEKCEPEWTKTILDEEAAR